MTIKLKSYNKYAYTHPWNPRTKTDRVAHMLQIVYQFLHYKGVDSLSYYCVKLAILDYLDTNTALLILRTQRETKIYHPGNLSSS